VRSASSYPAALVLKRPTMPPVSLSEWSGNGKFFQAFCQVFCKFFLVLSSFSKDSFGGFVGFQGGGDSKFFDRERWKFDMRFSSRRREAAPVHGTNRMITLATIQIFGKKNMSGFG
jgi:hypothetical protein